MFYDVNIYLWFSVCAKKGLLTEKRIISEKLKRYNYLYNNNSPRMGNGGYGASLIMIFFLHGLYKTATPEKVHNSESMTIYLGDHENFDDLEMVTEGKQHCSVNQKMERFHEFVKNTKIVKHPWEKLFIKNIEYRKSEESYQKLMQDITRKMRDFNDFGTKRKTKDGLNLRQIIKMANPNFIDKRQLSDRATVQDDDQDDDDDGDDDDKNSAPQPDSKPSVLKMLYENQILKEEEKEKAFKYSDQGKPEESVQEAFHKIIDMKTPVNCSNVTGFGILSMECIIKNYKAHEMTGQEAFKQFIKMFLVWVDVYLTVAIPLWCIKGWGCCCIAWEYCHPRKIVKDVQRYIADNPPGVYVNERGEEEHYDPSVKEKELYDKINKKILRI